MVLCNQEVTFVLHDFHLWSVILLYFTQTTYLLSISRELVVQQITEPDA